MISLPKRRWSLHTVVWPLDSQAAANMIMVRKQRPSDFVVLWHSLERAVARSPHNNVSQKSSKRKKQKKNLKINIAKRRKRANKNVRFIKFQQFNLFRIKNGTVFLASECAHLTSPHTAQSPFIENIRCSMKKTWETERKRKSKRAREVIKCRYTVARRTRIFLLLSINRKLQKIMKMLPFLSN